MSIDDAWNEKETDAFWSCEARPIGSKNYLQVGQEEALKYTTTVYPTLQDFKNNIPTNELKSDMVNHPSHYNQGGIECIDAIESALIGLSGAEAFYTGNIIKYIWRWKQKHGTEDLEKIEFYLNRLMKYVGSEK